jgi:N-acyl-L-homoserine lactone synthetase
MSSLFSALYHSDLEQKRDLFCSMLSDRAQQFVARLKWPLKIDECGLERDEYDDNFATYCVVAESGVHRASLRLREAGRGSMVERYFSNLWQPELRSSVEITRFCAAPFLSPQSRALAVSELLLGMCRHCQRKKIESLFGVVFPAVARVIEQAGWPGVRLNGMRTAEGLLLLMRWTPNDLVAWSIQERFEVREESRVRRFEAPADRLAA